MDSMDRDKILTREPKAGNKQASTIRNACQDAVIGWLNSILPLQTQVLEWKV